MSAGAYNFTIEQGARFARTFQLLNGVTPVNLTGYTIQMQIRPYPGSADLIADWSSYFVLDPLLGKATLTVTEVHTTAITQGGYYDMKFIAPDGVVTRELQGQAALSKQVTV